MIRIGLQNDPYAYNTLAELDGVVYRFLVRWNWRTSDWRISIQDTRNSRYIVTNRRISPGSIVTAMPNGASIQAFGADPYNKEALGVTLELYYYTRQDVLNLTAANVIGSDPQFTLR